MKKIGIIVILSFLIISSSSIFLTLYLGRSYEDFDDDDEYEEEDDIIDTKVLELYLFSMIGCNLFVPQHSRTIVFFRLNENLMSFIK